jgi:4-alpha-glucanotransferase
MSPLEALAAAHGLTRAYRDGAGRPQVAPDAALEAALDALGVGNPAAALPEALQRASTLVVTPGAEVPWDPGPWVLTLESGEERRGEGALPPLPMGHHRVVHNDWTVHLLAAPARLPLPPRRWGVTVPLFGLWSGARAGMGSYPMLGDLAERLAPHGAAFVGINPVHAGFPLDPNSFSPYAPSHRRRLNVLHIDAGAALPETGALIDHAATIPAQRAALDAAFAGFPGDPAFDAFVAAGGGDLRRFALHQALSERFGSWWGAWPEAYQSPESTSVHEFAARSSDRIRFHAWAQWMAERQLSDSQRRARAAGMAHGLYLDLAVGTHPHGAETWADPHLFARGVSLGAPPDLLGPSGQRWGLAPLRPDALAATGCAALAATLRAQLRFAGVLRIDHILGFERSFWLPDDLPGLYVAMPRAAMLAVVRIEAARAGAVIVGEDLGTIPEGLRAALSESGILGCRVAMFERDWDGRGAFLAPEDYTPTALASWGSHDLPTFRGWRAGRDLDWRERLGELPDPAAARTARLAEVAGWDALAGPAPEDLVRHLAATPSALVALHAEDLTGADEQANLPGTVFEHPNWCRRLDIPAQALADLPATTAAAALMATAGRNPEGPR